MWPLFPESGCWSVGSCYGFCDLIAELVFDGHEHSERGVPLLAVVEDLQVFEDRVGELEAGLPDGRPAGASVLRVQFSSMSDSG
jgi:hypothetical protein